MFSFNHSSEFLDRVRHIRFNFKFPIELMYLNFMVQPKLTINKVTVISFIWKRNNSQSPYKKNLVLNFFQFSNQVS